MSTQSDLQIQYNRPITSSQNQKNNLEVCVEAWQTAEVTGTKELQVPVPGFKTLPESQVQNHNGIGIRNQLTHPWNRS